MLSQYTVETGGKQAGVVVGHLDSSNVQRPRRRWFRFRFGLRTLLLLTAVVAVLLSFEARRAHDQRQLAARLDAFDAEYNRMPREWIPERVRPMLRHDQTESIVGVSLEGMQAPGLCFRSKSSTVTMEFVEPAEVEAIFAMPAMAHVRKLELSGNAVTDDILDELSALEHLEDVTFYSTAISNEAMQEWTKAHPDCRVYYREENNGLETVAGAALRVTDDLTLFIRADRGEPAAIKKLLHLAGNPHYERPRMLLDFLWRFDEDTALPFFTEALQTGNAATRQTVAELLGHLGQVDLLVELLNDPDTDVRTRAVYSLSRIDGQPARQSLLDAAENLEPDVRVAVLRELPKILGQEATPHYLAALKDPHPDVRWQAVYAIERTLDKRAILPLIESLWDANSGNRYAAARALGKLDDPRAVPALKRAAEEDEDSHVREAAQEALVKLRRDSVALSNAPES